MKKVAGRLKLIDLFAGCGGLTLGFTKVRAEGEPVFEPVWANDFNSWAVDTYNANFGDHCWFGDINDYLETSAKSLPFAEIVVGGPPCQGFSLLNKKKALDPRKALWMPFMDVVESSGASMFLMENVPQLLRSDEYRLILGRAKELGFEVVSAVLCAADYGVAQTRNRAFLFGSRIGDPADHFPPPPTHRDVNGNGSRALLNGSHPVKAWRTVRDALRALPEPSGTEIRAEAAPLDLHFGRNPTATSIMRYKTIPNEGESRIELLERAPHLTPNCWIDKKGGTDLFGRLWWDRPSVTIRTEFFKPEKGRYLHPSQHRPITHREAARLQSFPDGFEFRGSKIEIARQIGNAVPPRLALHIAKAVYSHWVQNTTEARNHDRHAHAGPAESGHVTSQE